MRLAVPAGFSEVMVGRRAELERLRGLLDRARRSDAPTAVLLAGEAGIGKTRLLRELVAGLAPQTTMLAAGARPGRAEAPFALLRDAVAPTVAGWDQLPEDLAGLERPLAELLGPLARWAQGSSDTHGSIEDLSWAGLRLVSYLVGHGPSLIVFEDLHWADAESVALFERLAADGAPALAIATVRPEDVEQGSPLASVLHDLRRSGNLEHLGLQRLMPGELHELVESICGRPVGASVTEALYERTRGSPYLLEELIAGAATGVESGRPVDVDPAVLVDASLPWDTTRAVLQRLSGLSQAALATARAAAVLGHEVHLDVLEAVSETGGGDLVPILCELVDAGVLVEEAEDVLSFRHALTHEAVLEPVLSRERQRLHRRALETLRTHAIASPGAMARHAAGAGDAVEAAEWALQAARQALNSGAPRHALRTACLGLEQRPDDPGLHAVAARAAERLGELGDAVDHARSWAGAAAAETDHRQASEAAALLAWVLWSAGDGDGAWRQLIVAEEEADRAADAGARAAAAAVRAQLHMLAGDAATALEVADTALRLAEEIDDQATAAHALATRGAAMVDLVADEDPARVAAARVALLRARDLATATGAQAALARAVNNLLMPGTGLLDDREARDLLVEARELADRHGLERLGAKAASLTVHAAIVAGDRDAAERAMADRRLRQAAPMESTWVASMEAHLAAEDGDAERARAAVEACRRQVGSLSVPESVMYLATAEAELASVVGDANAAEHALVQAGQAVPTLARGAAADWWIVGVLALRAGGDPRRLDRLAARLGPPRVRRYLGAAAHFKGSLCAATDREDEAIEHLRLAVEAPIAGRPRAMLAAARHQLAELLAAAGERAAAREHAARAATDLERWPGPRQQAAVALQRRLGDGPPQPAELLTPREHEVVHLLVRGYSNGEIAKRLFISPKTAATHVTNILAKTQLQRRGQVAAWALQHGIVSTDLGPLETD